MRESREPPDPTPPVFDQRQEVAAPPAGVPAEVEPEPSQAGGSTPTSTVTHEGQTMIPARWRRRTWVERVSMRIIATCGVIGINTALGAILVSSDVQGWIVGLAVSANSVLLAALLWSSRQL